MASTLTKCGLIRSSKITVPSKWRSSKYVVFPQRQPYFTYGDLHSSGLKNYAFQLTILQCKICRYSDCFKMCLFPKEFEYFCITLPQPWPHEAWCDRQNYKLKWAYNFDAASSWIKCRPSKKRSLGSRNLQNMLYFLSASYIFAFWGVRGARPRRLNFG